MSELGFERAKAVETGRPGDDPRDLLKLYLCGYLNQIRSSRRLEAECRRNVELMWLLGRLYPDHKSTAEFRRIHRESTCTPVTFRPIALTALSKLSCLRPVMNTYAPSSTNSFADASAIPEVAPVITATLPSNLPMTTPLLVGNAENRIAHNNERSARVTVVYAVHHSIRSAQVRESLQDIASIVSFRSASPGRLNVTEQSSDAPSV
jgi:hypothetical protein